MDRASAVSREGMRTMATISTITSSRRLDGDHVFELV